jgi:hypothetical protein
MISVRKRKALALCMLMWKIRRRRRWKQTLYRRPGLVTGEVTYGVDRQTYEFRFDLPVTLIAMIDAGGGEE